jgi:hypothetical protein
MAVEIVIAVNFTLLLRVRVLTYNWLSLARFVD